MLPDNISPSENHDLTVKAPNDPVVIELQPDFISQLISSVLEEGQRQPNDIYKLFWVYKWVKKDKNIQAVKGDKRWDELNFDREKGWAKKILEAYSGDVQKAGMAIRKIGEHFEKRGWRSWKLYNIYSNLTDWEEGRLG